MSKWWNSCDVTVPAALRFLAEHTPVTGGSEKYNWEHLHQLADEIEKIVQETGWIDVNTRLPNKTPHELFVDVWVLDKIWAPAGRRLTNVMFNNGQFVMMGHNFNEQFDEITHWMPLPSNPLNWSRKY